jgi:hypothetical protein
MLYKPLHSQKAPLVGIPSGIQKAQLFSYLKLFSVFPRLIKLDITIITRIPGRRIFHLHEIKQSQRFVVQCPHVLKQARPK